MEIVVNGNKNHGLRTGFSLSGKAIKEYFKLLGEDVYFYTVDFEKSNKINEVIYTKTDYYDKGHSFISTKYIGDEIKGSDVKKLHEEKAFYYDECFDRTDKNLIKVVKQLGEEANSEFSDLKIIEIPDGVEYYIVGDLPEEIHEKHRVWKYEE